MDGRLTLELLPNELLLDIFEYLPVQDLYNTFSDLNSRLTNILNSFQGFHFEQRQSEDIDNSAFADRVTTLIVRHSDPIELSRYPNLQALKLEWPSQQQCNQTIHQSQLKHLYIGHALHEGDTEQLLKHVFANGFPQLRSCHLENLQQLRSVISGSATLLPTLCSIKIFTVHSQDFVRLLSLCPNLTRLSIKFFTDAGIDLNTFKQWLPIPHENLRTLIFDTVDHMSIETIDSMLTFVPNVTYLSINNPRSRRNRINIEQIARSLHRHMSKLCQFNAIIWLDDLNSNFLNNIQLIQSLHPLFNQVRLSSGGGRLIISSSSY
jgi:hypothetical protein